VGPTQPDRMTGQVDVSGKAPGPPGQVGGADALLLGIPVYLAQRRRLTEPGPVPAYR